MAKVRLSVTIEEELKKYIEEECKRMGVSQAAYISLLISQRKDGAKALTALDEMLQVYKKEVENK